MACLAVLHGAVANPVATTAQPTVERVANGCAFQLTSSNSVDVATKKSALTDAIIQITNNAAFRLDMAEDMVLAAFTGGGPGPGETAKSLCESLPDSLSAKLDQNIFGTVEIFNTTIAPSPPSARSCYLYGWDQYSCGYGDPMFGCSEYRTCKRYKRGRCAQYARKCCCGGSFFWGCGSC